MDKNDQNSQSMCEIHEDFFDDEKSQTEEIPLSGSRFYSLSLHHNVELVHYIPKNSVMSWRNKWLDSVSYFICYGRSRAGGINTFQARHKKCFLLTHSLDSDKSDITDATHSPGRVTHLISYVESAC